MTVASHVAELVRKHQALDHKVVAEQKRPGACSLILRGLKKQKLALKDEIRRLEDAS